MMRSLVLFFLLSVNLGYAVRSCAAEKGAPLGLEYMGEHFIPVNSFLDNTNGKTAALQDVPGWIFSDGQNPREFGVVFQAGPSEYLLSSVSILVMTAPQESEFNASFKVSLYEVEPNGYPRESAVKMVEISDHLVKPRENYIVLPLKGFRLEAGRWYALTVSAPNKYATRIMGYQVPDVSPDPSLGFEIGRPIYGGIDNHWGSLGNPYLQVQGWDLQDPAILSRARWVLILSGVSGFLLVAVVILFLLKRRNDGVS